MRNLFMLALSFAMLTSACNDNDKSTGNGANMPATDNAPGNSTSDHLHNNNVNSGMDETTTSNKKERKEKMLDTANSNKSPKYK